MHGPRDHTGVSVGECLVKTRALHLILDGADRLLHVELCTPKLCFLLTEIVKLLFNLDLQLEFLVET